MFARNTNRFKVFSYDAIMQRDKVSLDIFWLKDESLEDTENLLIPMCWLRRFENLEAALIQFDSIVEELGEE